MSEKKHSDKAVSEKSDSISLSIRMAWLPILILSSCQDQFCGCPRPLSTVCLRVSGGELPGPIDLCEVKVRSKGCIAASCFVEAGYSWQRTLVQICTKSLGEMEVTTTVHCPCMMLACTTTHVAQAQDSF